jgi:hypothetical protein
MHESSSRVRRRDWALGAVTTATTLEAQRYFLVALLNSTINCSRQCSSGATAGRGTTATIPIISTTSWLVAATTRASETVTSITAAGSTTDIYASTAKPMHAGGC